MMWLGTCWSFLWRKTTTKSSLILEGNTIQSPNPWAPPKLSTEKSVICCSITNCPKTSAAGKNKHCCPGFWVELWGLADCSASGGLRGAAPHLEAHWGLVGVHPSSRIWVGRWHQFHPRGSWGNTQSQSLMRQLSGRNTAQLTVTPLHTHHFPRPPWCVREATAQGVKWGGSRALRGGHSTGARWGGSPLF